MDWSCAICSVHGALVNHKEDKLVEGDFPIRVMVQRVKVKPKFFGIIQVLLQIAAHVDKLARLQRTAIILVVQLEELTNVVEFYLLGLTNNNARLAPSR